MDSKHLILKEDAWLERLTVSGTDSVTAYPNLVGHTRDGWLASFKEAHRTCLLADASYELVVFGSRSDEDQIAFDQLRSWIDNHSLGHLKFNVMLHD